MLRPVNPQDAIALGRLLEFFTPTPAWSRSLWGVGLVLGLRELSEASDVLQQGTLSEASVRRICSTLQRKVGLDPALSTAEKAHLRLQIGNPPRADGAAHHTIDQMADLLAADYPRRWAPVVAQPGYAVELFARSMASHMLDLGFSAQYLHEHLKSLARSATPVSLADMCESLHAEQTGRPARDFEVMLAFPRPPKLTSGIPAGWLQGDAVKNWLVAHGFETADFRAPVATVLTVQARDGFGAAAAAREISDRFAARVRIATGHSLERTPYLWVAGMDDPVALRGESRGVRVKELEREGRIFTAQSTDDSVEAALELLAHLDESSPPAAIAGGWGAIEGLLADPGDRATAADNLAALVACSFPRQELTALSFKVAAQDAAMAEQIAGLTTNRDRSMFIAQLIHDGRLPPLKSLADQAAVARLAKLMRDPPAELRTIKEVIAEAFHRLYRQRNLILHGGVLSSVTLKASLRTVAKLAGAGMDRITHGHYVQNLRPLELVARANLSIALAAKTNPLGCVDLLERR